MSAAVSRDLTLEPTRAAPGQARHAVRELLAGVDDEVAETTELLVSELVTNALTHGYGPITLHLTAVPGAIEVEVGDLNADLPVIRADQPLALGGRGLRMVESLSAEWGVKVRGIDSGKVIWFRLT